MSVNTFLRDQHQIQMDEKVNDLILLLNSSVSKKITINDEIDDDILQQVSTKVPISYQKESYRIILIKTIITIL